MCSCPGHYFHFCSLGYYLCKIPQPWYLSVIYILLPSENHSMHNKDSFLYHRSNKIKQKLKAQRKEASAIESG